MMQNQAISVPPPGYGALSSCREQLFKEFLNFMWLRPESAMLKALSAEAYLHSMQKYFTPDAALEISCGDGSYSFIAGGGKMTPDSDMYRAINTNKLFRDEHHDVFDKYDHSYIAQILQESAYKYSCACDWKQNLLDKAKSLNIYKTMFLHDNNCKIPLQDGSFGYIFNNSSYWVDHFEFHLNDMVRLLKPGGHMVLEMMTSDNIPNLSSSMYAPFMGRKFHEIIDAGRLATWKGIKSYAEIFKIIEKIKAVEVWECIPVYGDIAAMMWDVGLRPLFTPLARMANSLDPKDRVSIKNEWNLIFFEMLQQFIVSYQPEKNRVLRWLIVLKKVGDD